MQLSHYILDPSGQIRRVSLREWAVFMETADRRVALTSVLGFDVSTVFLGLDHNFRDEGQPVLWETMVFDQEGARSEWSCRRCAGDRDQALAQHEEVVRSVEQALGVQRTTA